MLPLRRPTPMRTPPPPHAVNEDYKIRIVRLVEDFRQAYGVEEKVLPDLNNHERRYIHELAKRYGLKTKSQGKEPNRVLVLSKFTIQVQEPTLPLQLAPHTQAELDRYFAQNPITQQELKLNLEVTYPTSAAAAASRHKHNPKANTHKPPTAAPAASPPPVLASRMQLPVWQHREEICRTVRDNPITILSGETGSGKSTQVVQYLLDDASSSSNNTRIVCTQPRRLPCLSLAARVCEERQLGAVGGEVGYSVRFDSKYSDQHTRLLFCTTGMALMKLQQQNSNSNSSSSSSLFDNITHLVLDEVHDRDANTDFLLVFCKEMLARRIKIVLMSATLKVGAFLSYFSDFQCGAVQLEGRSFPVDAYFLEDVLLFTGAGAGGKLHAPQHLQHQEAAEEEEAGLKCPLCQHTGFASVEEFTLHVVSCTGVAAASSAGAAPSQWLEWTNPWEETTAAVTPLPLPPSASASSLAASATTPQRMVEEYLLNREDENEADLLLIVKLIETIAGNVDDTSVLVFLPGWFEITSLVAMLETSPVLSSTFAILPLHSGISPKDQWRIFDAKTRRKIICSTNIAETSLTIPDVEYVIDSCLAKEKGYDPQTKSSSLQSTFISRSSAMQRRGRAGRCFHGTCFHLVSRQRFSSLLDFTVPEILRTPLEQICLQARAIVSTQDFPSIGEFLSRAMDPPAEQTVRDALASLTDMGALTRRREELTALGRMLSTLPMDPKLGKMLLLAGLMECLDPALTLAVASGFRDPFVLDVNGARNNPGKLALSRSIPALGAGSDHAAVLVGVRGFERQGGRAYCQRYSLAVGVVESMAQMKRQVRQQLGAFAATGTGTGAGDKEHTGLVQALICAGTVPNLAFYRGDKFVSGKHARIRLHASSCAREENNAWFAFEELVRNNRGSCLRTVTRIDPLIVVLFAGSLGVGSGEEGNEGDEGDEDAEDEEDRFRVLEDGVVRINAWARIKCTSLQVAQQLAVLRLRLETSFLNAVERGAYREEDRAVARFVSRLIAPLPLPPPPQVSAGNRAPKTPLRPNAAAYTPQKKATAAAAAAAVAAKPSPIVSLQTKRKG